MLINNYENENFPVGFPDPIKQLNLLQHYLKRSIGNGLARITVYPTIYLVDKNGKIIFTNVPRYQKDYPGILLPGIGEYYLLRNIPVVIWS